MRQVHDLGIHREWKQDGFTVVEIDTARARYFDLPWKSLGAYGKRKFENWLVINRSHERLKLIYKP